MSFFETRRFGYRDDSPCEFIIILYTIYTLLKLKSVFNAGSMAL